MKWGYKNYGDYYDLCVFNPPYLALLSHPPLHKEGFFLLTDFLAKEIIKILRKKRDVLNGENENRIG